jgi:CRISPR-associated endonuclease Cas1
MRTQATDSVLGWPSELRPNRGVLVLSGYGLDVRVSRGRLRIADGIGHDRREGLVHRATGGLRRLVVLGHTGLVTLDAIRWLADVGAGYLQIDADGQVLAAFGPQGSDRPGLRRAQARALDTELGDGIARRLVGEKIAAQAETLVAVDRAAPVADVVIESLRSAATALHVAVGRDEIRVAEARAAASYWSAWSGLSVAFARRDAADVPAHWRTFGARSSPLTGAPRLAANPANALLNYLYALLEGEAAIAARVVGLDAGLGVLHADQPSRDSLAADLMEPVRPLVDRFVLDLLADRYFATADFYETRQGVCRVTPTLATDLAATSPVWARAVGRVAEDVAESLTNVARQSSPTPITGRRRAASRPGGARQGLPVQPPFGASRGCRSCGSAIRDGRRTCSADCAAVEKAEHSPAFIAAGQRTLAALREVGFQSTIPAEGRRRIGTRASETLAAARDWQRVHPWPADLKSFEREILPGLAAVPARVLAEATGLSVGYCRRVKAGLASPHPMWWDAMRAMAR